MIESVVYFVLALFDETLAELMFACARVTLAKLGKASMGDTSGRDPGGANHEAGCGKGTRIVDANANLDGIFTEA